MKRNGILPNYMPPSARTNVAADAWAEDRLVKECLKGNEEAWSALVERYKNLVYSIPVKYGIVGDDSSDIFQVVFFELLSHLGEIRNPKALPMWLIQTASRKCLSFRRGRDRFTALEDEENAGENFGVMDPAVGEQALHEFQQEHSLGKALDQLSPRCRKLVEMLFFEVPARPYEEIAKNLGLKTGSIGFIRGRCLEKLRGFLDQAGFSREL
jgi:RNA polymerase sigma factor (sigma-70 family)